MTDNTVKFKDSKGNSIDVYANNISLLADEYIYNLSPGYTSADKANRDSMIRRTPIFKGMLKYIYNNMFKADKGSIYNSNIDYSDIDSIDNIWDIYTSLCYKYCQNPTLLNFSLMTGISMDCFNDWKNQTNRAYIYYDKEGNRIKNISGWKLNHQGEECRQELSSSFNQAVKRWLKECESAAYDVALSGNPGGMFILKANYGYAETAPVQTHDPNTRPSVTQAELEQQFGCQALISGKDIDSI